MAPELRNAAGTAKKKKKKKKIEKEGAFILDLDQKGFKENVMYRIG